MRRIPPEVKKLTIGDLISTQRKALGYTLEDVGKAVGVTKATVLRWETGAIQSMKRDKIAALSRFLNLDPTLFISPTEVLTSDEKKLLTAYRAASREARGYAMDILEKSAAERKGKGDEPSSARMA